MPAPSTTRWHPAAAVASWLLPGLGHVLLGQNRRGACVAAGILGLWALGVLIGGLGIVSRVHHPLWFLGQTLLAPSLVVEFLAVYLRNAGMLSATFGRPAEFGLLCTALAGGLNLMAILDTLYRDPDDARHRPDQAPAQP